MKTDHFVLDNFEGSVDFLLNLIQQDEIPIHEVPIRQLTTQFLERFKERPALENGAEFIGSCAFLLWLKSKTLLPQHESEGEEEESDPRFAIIHQLLDYCRFKEAAKSLEEREVNQSAYYVRGHEGYDAKKNLGIDHLSIEELAGLFKQILAKADLQKGSIQEEEWRVSDKIEALFMQLESSPKLPLEEVFIATMGRLELIVTFLALLELMKRGAVKVVRVGERLLVAAS